MIIRISNLLLGNHATYHRHSSVIARPFQVMLDPSNTCQLECPGCVHSPTVARRANSTGFTFDWPKGLMAESCYDKIIKNFAPYAFASTFYNYGEPLINRKTPAMIRRARDLLHYTWLSSNLSLSFDVDALVSCGLDSLIISVDGTSQQTLGHYRRRAKWDLCLANMHKLVEAKRRLDSRIQLEWQFLTFEHNVHEVPLAMRMAKDIGLDSIRIQTPFGVSWDAPDVKKAISPLVGQHRFPSNRPKDPPKPDLCSTVAALEPYAELIDEIFKDGWENRMARFGVVDEPSRAGGSTCEWLYQNITIDASARLMPCCVAPGTNMHVVYGSLNDDDDGINTEGARLSRLAFADRDAYKTEIQGKSIRPYCARCKMVIRYPFTREGSVRGAVSKLDGGVLLNWAAAVALTKWNH